MTKVSKLTHFDFDEIISAPYQINGNYDAPLSNIIQNEYNKLIIELCKHDEQSWNIKYINGTGGIVSISDIVAYQIGWGKLLIGWYKSGLKGKTPKMPGEGFTTWDYNGLALHFYSKYQYNTMTDQLKNFKKIVLQIIGIVETEYMSGNLDKENVWNWCQLKSGKYWPLSKWITVNTSAPYIKARNLIKKYSQDN